MNFIWVALLLGLAGSLHCLGMCGPLVIALHNAQPKGTAVKSKIIYHLARISVYASLGFTVGIVGSTFSFFGWQQLLSITAGFLMLFFIIFPSGVGFVKNSPLRIISFIKARFGYLIQRKNGLSFFLLGAINGLLPCGLVYTAMAAALATGSLYKSVGFMLLFGLATSPILFVATEAINWMMKKTRFRSYKTVQIILATVSLLVILRGAGLGIPFISPAAAMNGHSVNCCHK